MNILLYNNISDRRTLTKSITLIRELTGCELYDGSSLLTPVFKLKYNKEYLNCNYIHIPEFNRYYFCKPEVVPGGIIYFRCSVDVLMSANTLIKNLNVRVRRYERKVAPYVLDSQVTKISRTETTNLYFSESPFFVTSDFNNQYTWLLTVVGGDGGTQT